MTPHLTELERIRQELRAVLDKGQALRLMGEHELRMKRIRESLAVSISDLEELTQDLRGISPRESQRR